MAGNCIIDVMDEDFDVDSKLRLDVVNKRMEQSLVNVINDKNLEDWLPEVQALSSDDLKQRDEQCLASNNEVLYDAHDGNK